MVFAGQVYKPPLCSWTKSRRYFVLQASEKPVVRTHLRPTKFLQLDGLFLNVNRRPGNHSQEPPVQNWRRWPSGRSGTGRGTRQLSGRLSDRVGGIPAGYSPRPPGHRWAPGTSRKLFQDVCERAGLGGDWAPWDLRPAFVSLLSADGMAIEKIARLVGHASSHVTEIVYRQELRPVCRRAPR
jgi:integrase